MCTCNGGDAIRVEPVPKQGKRGVALGGLGNPFTANCTLLVCESQHHMGSHHELEWGNCQGVQSTGTLEEFHIANLERVVAIIGGVAAFTWAYEEKEAHSHHIGCGFEGIR